MAPFLLSRALPRDFPDLLAIILISLSSFEASFVQNSVAGLRLGPLIFFLTIPPACALASMSNSLRKIREELAVLAYGGSGWQVWVRHFLRGLTCSLIAVSIPLLSEISLGSQLSTLQASTAALATLLGGISYVAPALHRIRSVEFAENYKA